MIASANSWKPIRQETAFAGCDVVVKFEVPANVQQEDASNTIRPLVDVLELHPLIKLEIEPSPPFLYFLLKNTDVLNWNQYKMKL